MFPYVLVIALIPLLVLCARYETVGNMDSSQYIQLKSQYDLQPGTALALNIEVKAPTVALKGRLPPRLVSINSINPDNIYGAGDKLQITLGYIANVDVMGSPTLTVNTGCHSDSCKVIEILSFVCKADLGAFSMRMEDQIISNINVNTTQYDLQNLFQQIEGIQNVTVRYSATSSSSVYAVQDRVCTPLGNNVTVYFNNVSFPHYDGNVPDFEFDVNNRFPDPRTGLNLGNGDYLRGVHGAFVSTITSAVLQQGHQQRDGTAFYATGSGTNYLNFEFTVRNGDSTGLGTLAVKSINFIGNNSIVSALTGEPVSTVIPDFLSGQRFMSNMSSILGYNRDIVISFARPFVKSLTSPVPDGIYTVGDIIPIYVTFSFPVKVFNGASIYLILSTGLESNPLLHDRSAYFIKAYNSSTLIFEYIVQPGDISPRLDVVGTDSLVQGSGYIYLDNRSNDTAAIVALPSPGTSGSLSANNNIEINTQAPLITGISVVSPNGTYTAGDSIYIDVTYTTRIVVYGRPILWLTNNVNSLNASIIDAPAFPVYSFGRVSPGFTAQITLAFLFNFDVNIGDSVNVVLPGFTHAENTTIYSSVMLRVNGASNDSFVAFWVPSNQTLSLIARQLIPQNTSISLSLDGSAGLKSPADGVSAVVNEPRYYVVSPSLRLSAALDFVFPNGYAVGVTSSSLRLTPSFDGTVSIDFAWSFPEYLTIGDSISIFLYGFVSNQSYAFVANYSTRPYLSLEWNQTLSSLKIVVVAPTMSLIQSINLNALSSFYFPSFGVNDHSVTFSTVSMLNGDVSQVPFASATSICGFMEMNLSYLSLSPGTSSGLQISWVLGSTGLSAGDVITVFLHTFTSTGVIYSNSPLASKFLIRLTNGNITFSALDTIPVTTAFSFTFDAYQGFVLPSDGISAVDTFSAIVTSSNCIMVAPQQFRYAAFVAAVDYAVLVIVPVNATIGQSVALNLTFSYSSNFTRGDILVLSMPSILRNPYLPHSVNVSSLISFVCTYEISSKSIVMIVNASAAPTLGTVSIYFNYDAGLSVSTLGLPNDSVTLAINSAAGSLSGKVVAVSCIGFCSGSIEYASMFVGSPNTVSMEFTFSADITNGTSCIVVLAAFVRMSSPVLILSLLGSYYATVPYAISYSPLNLNFTLPTAVPSGSTVAIQVSGVTFVSSTVTSEPSVGLVSSSVYPNGTIVKTFELPSPIFVPPNIVNTTLSFSNSLPGVPSSVYFSFYAVDTLITGSSIRLHLPQFLTVDGMSVSSPNTTTVNIVSLSSGVIIDIVLGTFVAAKSALVFDIEGLVLPAIGLSMYSDANSIPQYALSVASEVFAPYSHIEYFPEIIAIYGANIGFSFSAGFFPNSLTLNFELNTNLTSGDTITAYMPDLASNNFSFVTNDGSGLFSAQWNSSVSSIQMVVLSSISNSNYSLTLPAFNGSAQLSLPTWGYPGTTSGTLSIVQASVGRVTTGVIIIPCIGVCSAIARADIPKAGYPSDYSFNVIFGGRLFSVGDVISFTLTGFRRNTSSTAVTSNLTSILVSWNSSLSVLKIQALSGFINSSTLNILISADQLLLSPANGIRAIERFNTSWSTGSSILTSDAPILQFGVIGKFLTSVISMSPKVPGSSTNYNLTLAAYDELASGDLILVALPGATVPFGPIDHLVCNFNVSATGIPADDNTFLSFFHTSAVLLLLHQKISALSTLHAYIPSSSEITLPINGYSLSSPPEIAVVSSTSPITTTAFRSFSTVGSMTPATLKITGSTFVFTFTIMCSPETNSKLVIFMPNVIGADQPVTTSNNLGLQVFSAGLWSSQASSMAFVFLQSVPTNTTLKITVVASGLKLTNQILYTDDSRYKYSLTSALCSMDPTPFNRASSSLFSEATLRFATPVIQKYSNVSISILSNFDVIVGDTLAIQLPLLGNTYSNAANVSLSLEGITAPKFIVASTAVVSNGTVYFNLTSIATIAANTPLELILVSRVLIIPSTGILAGSKFPLSLIRQTVVLANGYFSDVEAISYFLSKSVVLSNPIAGIATGLDLSWKLATDTVSGDAIVFSLPGFLFSGSNIAAIPCTSLYAAYITCSWSPVTSQLSIHFAKSFTTRGFSISIRSSAGFLAPMYGIATVLNTYQVESVSTISPVYRVDLDFISLIPIVSGSIAFYSCEVNSMYESSGDPYSVFLRPGNALSTGDNDALVFIQNQIYSIQYPSNGSALYSVGENILPIDRAYNGSLVFGGDPYTEVYTSPIRPAYYFSGNSTTTIRFAYLIRRGDAAIGIHIAEPSLNNFISLNPDRNQGHLYRHSMNPGLEATAIISASIGSTAGVHIDSTPPSIIALSTSTPPGVYAAGDRLDFSVVFDYPVVVRNGTQGAPTLLLHVNPYSYVVAEYAAGSGSNTLTFVYTVVIQHFALQLTTALITTDYPIVQPLRPISNNYFGYIRRASEIPLIDVNSVFPSVYFWEIPQNLSIIGIAPRVIGLFSNTGSDYGEDLTAGDYIYVYVAFSQTINVTLGEKLPYIMLDMGHVTGSNATYVGKVGDDVLKFRYQIHQSDIANSSLLLFCGCSDFFDRTFMFLEDASITAASSSSIRTSIVLAQDGSPSSRVITSPFFIDNTVPTIIALTTNISSGMYSPGTSMVITVQFSRRVTVYGYITLGLKGDNTTCSARYYSGNNSDLLGFLYQVNDQSGTCRLDYVDDASLDVSKGQIMRYSTAPSIAVDVTLNNPGTETSLGIVTNIIIDSTPSKIVSVASSTNVSVIPMDSIAILTSILRDTAVTYRYAQEHTNIKFNASTGVDIVQLLLGTSFDDTVDASGDGSSSVLICNPREKPFSYMPLWVESEYNSHAASFQIYWWSLYAIQSTIDFRLVVDRPVLAPDSYLTLMNAGSINKAYLVEESMTWNLTIRKSQGFDLSSFQIEYEGSLTRCVSTHAPPAGILSVESVLNEILALKRLGVFVAVLEDTRLARIYGISFLRAPSAVLSVITDSGSCGYFMVPNSIAINPGRLLSYRYQIQDVSSILLTPLSYVAAGEYELLLTSESGLTLSPVGIKENSVRYEHFTDDGRSSVTMVAVHKEVPRIILAILNFGSAFPNTSTSVSISVCFAGNVDVGDMLSVAMPGFSYPSHVYSGLHTSIAWNAVNKTIVLNVSSAASTCIAETIPLTLGVKTPTHALFDNSPAYSFTYEGSLGMISLSPFQSISSIGFSRASIGINTPLYNTLSRINISFGLEALLPCTSSVIYVCLPGFTALPGTPRVLSFDGPFKNTFNLAWNGFSSCIEISPTFDAPPGYYYFEIPSSNAASLIVSPFGLSPLNPPTLAVSSSLWNLSLTSIPEFPYAVGVYSSAMNVTVSRPGLAISALRVSVNFTRVLHGPAVFSLTIPGVISNDDSVKLSWQQPDGSVWVWRDWEQTLSVTFNSSWSGQYIQLNLSVARTLIVMAIANVSITSSTISLNASDGFLLPTKLDNVNPIPIILSSYISFSSAIFASNSVVSVGAILNYPAYPGDSFSFLLYGINASTVRNWMVTGICVDPLSLYFDISSNLVTARISNNSSCASGVSHLNWTIKSSYGIPPPNSIVQLNSDAYKIIWAGSNFTTGPVTVLGSPVIGILSSAISFGSPYGSAKSDVTLKVITTTDLSVGDELLLYLPLFSSNSSISNVYDSRGNAWNLIWNQETFILRIAAQRNYPAMALNLTVPISFAFVLPQWGIISDYESLTISILKGGKVLNPQAIQQIENVGAVLAIDVRAVAQSKYTSRQLSEAIPRHRDVAFSINMTVSKSLAIGDVILIRAPSYTFYYDTVLQVSGSSTLDASADVDSYNKIIRIAISEEVGVNIYLSFASSDAIGIPLLYCNQLKSQCPIYIDIVSVSCPMANYLTYAECAYVFPFTSIALWNAEFLTNPTGAPSGQPTSSPSAQPTNQPSSQPTHQPSTQPSSQPSGQPSAAPQTLSTRRPTAIPSIRPTFVPSATPSKKPSATPTTQPTKVPTPFPSKSPTLVPTLASSAPIFTPSGQPTCQPSMQPSGQPTAAPSNPIASYLLRLELSFLMQTALPNSSLILISIPQIISTSDVNSTFVLGHQSNVWNSFWNGTSHFLQLRALTDIFPGLQSLSVVSSTLLLSDQIIYENDSSISYSISYGACLVYGGSFDKVEATGLKSSSLAFVNFTSFASSIGLEFSIVSERQLIPGDQLVIHLPNFTSNSTGYLQYSAGSDFAAARSIWKASLQCIKVTILSSLSKLHLVFSSSNGIVIPSLGSNIITGLPMVSLRTRNSFYYAPTEFLSFTPLAKISSSFLSFGTGVMAGQEVVLSIGFAYPLQIFSNDYFDIYLPNFWTSGMVTVLSNTSGFRGTWSSCTNTLRLLSSQSSSAKFYSVNVAGLRLPVDGISVDLARYYTIVSNATNGNIISTTIADVPLVGYFNYSSIVFDPPVLSSSVSLNFSFQPSFAIKPNETISLFLPGVSNSFAFSSSNLTNAFSIAWNALSHMFVFISINSVKPYQMVTIICNDSVTLPHQGFPNFNLSMFTAIASNASEGPVSPSKLDFVRHVGIYDASVNYDISDVNSPVAIRFQFRLSCALSIGDSVVVKMPVIVGPSGPANVTGNLAEYNFVPYFNASFSASTRAFTLICTHAIQSQYLAVQFAKSSMFYLDKNVGFRAHSVSGNFASIGTLTDRLIDVLPLPLIGLNNSISVSMENCNLQQSCPLSVRLKLAAPLAVGESIAIGHSAFVFLAKAYEAFVPTEGNASNYFKVSIRNADFFENISFLPDIQVGGGSLVSAADVPYHSVNSTLPAVDLGVAIFAVLPRIYSIFAETIFRDLECGDAVRIWVLFTEPVQVAEPSHIHLLLNTNEKAFYFEGNGSMSLAFIYHVDNPIDVPVLAVDGSDALTFTGNAEITRLGATNVRANATVPQPFELFTTNTKDTAFKLNVSCGYNFSNVLNVSSYAMPSTVTLATGDVAHIAVIFDRQIHVLGTPLLQLLGDNNTIMTATYRNVSIVQFISVTGPGDYTVSYGDEDSICIPWDSPSLLESAVSNLVGLTMSLPLKITTSVRPYGAVYRLEFQGLPPAVLSTSGVICDYAATASITVDDAMLYTAVFSYQVVEGDSAMHLSYTNSSAIVVDASDRIFLGPQFLGIVANAQLPFPGSQSSLYGTSNITVRTERPIILSISSNFTDSQFPYAVDGDVISIAVAFSAPVLVLGEPYLLLNVTSPVEPSPIASYNMAVGAIVYFEYLVRLGDFAYPLDTLSNSSLVLNGSSIYLKSFRPSTIAVVTTPVPRSSKGLSNSSIIVNASEYSYIYSVSCNQPPGVYGTNMSLVINLKFYDVITISNLTASPTIILADPRSAVMTYLNGSGTSTISFLYTIAYGDNSNHILLSNSTSFAMKLNGGYFVNSLGAEWGLVTRAPLYDLLNGIVIDTTPPFVVRVNSDSPNGTYYPGQTVDIYVTFSKRVQVFGTPKLEMFVPYEDYSSKLAIYASGNDSYEIHFNFMVPAPDYEFSFHPQVPLDYAGDNSLIQNMGTARIIEAFGIAIADTMLPIKDESYLQKHRSLFISSAVPSVVQVQAQNPNGIYTAGDVISIECTFSQPVMVFVPPVLRLAVGRENRNGIYVSGNFTSKLIFHYTVLVGDVSSKLDYVDTRYNPYNMAGYTTRSLALNTDVGTGTTGRLNGNTPSPRYNDVFVIATQYGGVFIATPETNRRVAADTLLPLPGSPGSLSASSNIVIDTTPPLVSKVFTQVPDGSYGENVVLPFVVRFTAPVVVGGCPFLVFQVHSLDRNAIYTSGNGTTDLVFDLDVIASDQKVGLDYANTAALRLAFCDPNAIFHNNAGIYIKRASMDPIIDAILTLPPVFERKTVISPTSITGGGQNLTVSGGAAHPRVVYSALGFRNATYSVGDIIDIRVHFSGPVNIPISAMITLSSLNHQAYFEAMINSTDALFTLVVQPSDSTDGITYPDQFSLRTLSSCDIVDLKQLTCASQDLPPPFSALPYALDLLSPLQMKIYPYTSSNFEQISAPSIPQAVRIAFQYPTGQTYYLSGDLICVYVTFSDAVDVVGEPYLQLTLTTSSVRLVYKDRPSLNTIAFALPITSSLTEGTVQCDYESAIFLNSGRITRANSFIPIQKADIAIESLCCRDSCNVSANIISMQPTVTRVYGLQGGTYAAPGVITIFVQYNRPVQVSGMPLLLLNMPNGAYAVFRSQPNPALLEFTYDVQSNDFSSHLDYASSAALYFIDPIFGGISLFGSSYPLKASLVLPAPGSVGSLGRETSIIIVADIPRLKSVLVTPTIAVIGDQITFTLEYSSAVSFYDASGNSASFSQVESSVSIDFSIIPSTFANGTFNRSNTGSPVARSAYFLSQQGSQVEFGFVVTYEEPTGFIELLSSAPIVFHSIRLLGTKFHTQSSSIVPGELVTVPLAAIDNVVPYVTEVTSESLDTGYPLGVGDAVYIYVHFSKLVVAFNVPALQLKFANLATTNASYVNSTTPATLVIGFKYVIQTGDDANPLDYDGIHALSGDIRRYSSRKSLLPANLTLPAPLSFSSLGDTSNLRVDTSPPHVVALFPANKPGLYGLNESIFVVCRFSKPVVVQGVPQLSLQVGNGTTGTAYFLNSFSSNDVRVEIFSTDLLFEYIVGPTDDISSLHHAGPTALFLPNGTNIYQLAANPSIAADISLRDYLDTSTAYGILDRQWMANYPQRVELLLRDVYHTAPASLSVTLEHDGIVSDVFSNSCPGKTFGNRYPRSRLGNNLTAIQPDADIGFDYFFSDTRSTNYALNGFARQSSTLDKYTAYLAIDGNKDSYISDLSVSSTTQEKQAWWLLELPTNTTVKTISIWSRTPQTWIPPVISLTVKQLDQFPRGFYKITFTNINPYDSAINITTGFISLGVNETEMARILNAAPGLGSVSVTMRVFQMCGINFLYRCSDDTEFGFGYVYTITLLNIQTAAPSLVLSSLTPLGGAVIGGAANETVNILQFLLLSTITLVTRGHPIPKNDNPQYPRGVKVNSLTSSINAGGGYNEWLTPCWVMLFGTDKVQPPDELEASKNASVWLKLFNSTADLEKIVLPKGIRALFLKIQRDSYGPLSLAEVEVYSAKLNYLKYYDLGSPVVSSTIINPYQTGEPLTMPFKYIDYNGIWTLRIQQNLPASSMDVEGGWDGAYGTISDYVLIVTDISGNVFTFYQDLVAEVTSLPKHGKLYATSRDNSSYWDFQEAFQVDPSNEIQTVMGGGRPLGLCYNDPHCANSAGKGPLLDDRRLFGNIPIFNYLSGERIVVYVPDPGYLGPDFFSYVIHQGSSLQMHKVASGSQGSMNEVSVNTRTCRRYQQELITNYNYSLNPLCTCAFNSTSTYLTIQDCTDSVVRVCASGDTFRNVFINMCETCQLGSSSTSLNATAIMSGDCSVEVYRAVWFAIDRGLCFSRPKMDCSSEIYGVEGTEARNYLSMKPPLLIGSLTPLGSSFGGYGWFSSSTMN